MLDEPITVPPEIEGYDPTAEAGKFRVLALGDSITAVSAMERQERWTGILEAKLGSQARVVNAGIGGTSSSLGLYRWKRDVAPVEPHCIVMCFLLNDSHIRFYETPSSYCVQCTAERMDGNMREIAERCRDMGAEPIIWTPPPVPGWPEAFKSAAHMQIQLQLLDHYLKMLERVAEELKVPVVNFWRTFPGLVDEFPGPYFVRPDGYHTTAKAQPILAQGIAEAIRPVQEAWNKNAR